MYPYDQGVMNNIKFVLGRQPLFWFWPRQMEGSGLSFPINITHLHTKGNTVTIEPVELDDINNDDKRSSVYSTWTTHTNYTQYSGGGDGGHDNGHDTVAMDHVTQVEPSHQHLSALRSKPSTTTLHTPTTPGSILTFASTASTLVDPRTRRPSDSKSYY
jgi:palmitoyltransferase